MALRGLVVLLLAGFGVWMLAGVAWALIAGAALILLDLLTDTMTGGASDGRADRSA